MNLAAVAAAPDSTAFPAYFSLVAPTLRDVARRPLRRARHDGRACSGIDGTRWCDECEQTVHDHLLDGYAKLRKALTGAPPLTRAGEPVREMEAIVRWLTSPEATANRVDLVAGLIRKRPSDGEPVGVRAARAQLVHHPLRSFEARVRREIAVSRGASAQPERDLRKSDWARPLRDNEVALELLIDAVIRLRNGACDPYDIPAKQLDRHDLDMLTARRSLREALSRLRALRPDFYMANVTIHLEQGDFFPGFFQTLSHNPEDLVVLGEEEGLARRTLSMLLAGERTAGGQARYRLLLARICADSPMSSTELVAWTAREFEISPTAADRFVRRLITLISQADLSWVAYQCQSVS
jgi:hypothetical protein